MSIAAISWVFKQEIKPSSLKFVLVALADCADDKGICWPSVDHIAETTCQDRKTVIKSLDDLESRGWLVDTGKRMGRTNQVKVYRLTDALFRGADTKACGKSAENGTLSKESQISAETVPFFRGKSTENGFSPTPPYKADPSLEPSLKPSAAGKEFFQQCFDYITVKFPNLTDRNTGVIYQWKNAGYDFETQIKPTVDSVAARGLEPRSFNFFTSALSDLAKPLTKAPKPVERIEITPEVEAKNRRWYREHGRQHPVYNPEGVTERENA